MNQPDLIPAGSIREWVWTSLSHGADLPDHPFHLLTMASVSPDGSPSARIMTNRGVDREVGCLWFYTRVDTPKIADIRARPRVCIVGYDPTWGVQIRLSGDAALHQHGPLADHHWNHIADVSRWLFHLRPEQGASAVGIDPRLPQDPEQLTHGLTARSRAQFGVLEVSVETIDWHQATGSRQRRAVLHARDQWQALVVD